MPWKQLSSWNANAEQLPCQQPMPLTLVRLSVRADATAEELAFYAQAEISALMAWAASGRFVMAFASTDHEELTLVCAGPLQAVMTEVKDLPLVAAGLASADIRSVVPLRLTRGALEMH